jgi:hypothetical protein
VDVGVTIYWTVPAVELPGLVNTSFIVAPPPAVAPVMPPLIVPTVHVNVDGALAVKEIFGLVALQMEVVAGFVTTGFGLTVTVMVYGAPTQLPVVDVGVTIYWTDPAVELLGLVSVWLMVVPLPAVAPVILPDTVPIVHANVLGALAVSVMFGLVPVQVEAVAGFVTAGVGFTVIVIVYGAPTQLPVVDVGVTIYSTLPAALLDGLVNTWLIVVPLPAVAPVMPPLMVPIVHANVAGALDVSAILGLVLLQIAVVAAFVTAGFGFTVTVIVYGVPTHPPVVEVGVTIYWTVPATALLGLVNTSVMFAPPPAVAPVIPPLTVPIVHVNVLGALDVSVIFGLVALQIEVVAELVTAGFGFTVIVMVNGAPAHPPVVDVGVTIYWTDPAVELLGLVSVWLIVVPDPAVAPVILPDTVPIVHANVLGAVAASAMFGLVPVHVEAVAAFVTAGVGFTVIVIVYGVPTQPPVTDVGVTIYSTLPAALLDGLVNTWLIVLPLPAVAPVIPPLMVPIVQVNVDAALAVKARFGLVALQIESVAAFVTAGLGLTVTVMV